MLHRHALLASAQRGDREGGTRLEAGHGRAAAAVSAVFHHDDRQLGDSVARGGRARWAGGGDHSAVLLPDRLAASGILLAVAQKRIVAQIEAIGPLPRNVEWLHHGAVSGIDSFREVSRIVVVGRQAPSPSAVQACAEALTGAACTRLPARQWYQRIDAVHELTDGRLVATERDGHPDSIAEAFRRRITVLELQQIIGRGRGLWRTADNPLHVLVLTDVPLDMPVEELTTDAAERPSFEDRQIAVGAIAFAPPGMLRLPVLSARILCPVGVPSTFLERPSPRVPRTRPRPARRNHRMAIPDCRPR